jgi:hypothetical protein
MCDLPLRETVRDREEEEDERLLGLSESGDDIAKSRE